MRRRRGLTRNQFFMVTLTCSFTYYVLPIYVFLLVTSMSWIYLIFPKFVRAQHLGSGLHGLRINVIGIDWSTISSYMGSSLDTPWFAIDNMAIEFVIVLYVLTPLVYWFNLYVAKTFLSFSVALFHLQSPSLQYLQNR